MKKELYDLIIIGAGPAGLSAALYAGRAKLKTLIIDSGEAGGQIRITSEVVNYPGVLHTTGPELSETMKKQAINFGAKIINAEVLNVNFTDDLKIIETNNGTFESVGVIIATGAQPKKLGFSGEEEYNGRGIGYCATCDGEFFTDLDIFVIGGGFAATEEALFLTRYGKQIHMIVRESELSVPKTIAEEVLENSKIKVHFNTEILSVSGDKVLKSAKFINNITNESWEYNVQDPDPSFGIFVFIGYEPLSFLFKDKIKTDEYGYILTDEDLETNIKGVYAAGDIRPKKLRQLVTAVSDGAIAATSAEKFINTQKRKLGIVIEQEKEEEKSSSESFIDEELANQLSPILSRFENNLTLAVITDGNTKLSNEIKTFVNDIAKLTDKIKIEIYDKEENTNLEKLVKTTMYPLIAIMDKDDNYTGIKYHGIPSGHEFNSFVIAMYNVAGPGQAIEQEKLDKIKSISKDTNIQIAVSLTCTMCPDVVQAAQLIAKHNKLIEATMIDISEFSEFKNKHSIMSVPALILNDEHILFGRKSLDEIIDFIKERD